MKTSNTLRIIGACLSMSDCDIQRAWFLLATRAAWHCGHGTPRMRDAFIDAVQFFAERYEGLFRL